MPKVSGVDFSAMTRFRDNVSVILLDGSVAELPLIPVKYATEGLTLLQRNDTMASRYAIVQTKLSLKAKALEEVRNSLGDDPEKMEELVTEDQLDVFEKTYASMQELQAQTAELCREANKLSDEIIEYLRPHIEASILEQVQQMDDRGIVMILELMLYGEDALSKEESEKEEENPSTQPSQLN